MLFCRDGLGVKNERRRPEVRKPTYLPIYLSIDYRINYLAYLPTYLRVDLEIFNIRRIRIGSLHVTVVELLHRPCIIRPNVRVV